MTLSEIIAHLEQQLSVPHSQPYTLQRLKVAHSLYTCAQTAWETPGEQDVAVKYEREAREILRNLDQPIIEGA